jgi:hypothetical protein
MTSQEYTQWLKGFLDAINGYDISKKQFDTIREKLKEVNDTIGTPIGIGGWGTPNQIGGGWTTISSPAILPLSGTSTGGTLTTSSYPSGSTITYTTTNGSGGAYTLTGNTTTTSAYVNQIDDGDEKLLLD